MAKQITRSHNRGRATATNFTSETLLNRGNVENVQMGVADGALGLILDMLTDISANCGAYAVRETYSNAQDAIRGMENGRIDITLSLSSNASGVVARILENTRHNDTFGCFTISDNGIGMSADDVRNLFLQYGGSNKRDNADSIGSKGLGSKAPLAITDNFMVITVKDGIETTVNIHRDGDNNSADIQSCSTDKPNGTSVIVPIMSSETYTQVEDCIGLLKDNNYDTDLFVNGEPVKKIIDDDDYISSVIKINDTDSVQVVVEVNSFFDTFGGRWDSFYCNRYDEIHQFAFFAIIGGYPYTLKNDMKNKSYYYYYSQRPIVRVLMQPGFFDFTPSRDEIMDNNAFNDFMSVFLKEWENNINVIVEKSVNRVLNNDNLSLSDKVAKITHWHNEFPKFSFGNSFDNQYKITDLITYTSVLTNTKEYNDMIQNRDTSIPSCFTIEKTGNQYRTYNDCLSYDTKKSSLGNMSRIVGHIKSNIHRNQTPRLDNLFYCDRLHLKDKVVVIHNGTFDEYEKIIRTFGCTIKAFQSHLGDGWQHARFIFLLDTDQITDNIKELINLMGLKGDISQIDHKEIIKNTKYFTLEAANTIINNYRNNNKANHKNQTKLYNCSVIMYDKNDYDNDNITDWEQGHTITNLNDIKNGFIIFTNSTRIEKIYHKNLYNSIHNLLKDSTEYTKGYLIKDAKADTVRAIMTNPNLHVLADRRNSIKQENKYPNMCKKYHLDTNGQLYCYFTDYVKTTSTVYNQLMNEIKLIAQYGQQENIINILLDYYNNKTNQTPTDQNIINILNEIITTRNTIQRTPIIIKQSTNTNTGITNTHDLMVATIIKTIKDYPINTLYSLVLHEGESTTTGNIINNTLINYFDTIINEKMKNTETPTNTN